MTFRELRQLVASDIERFGEQTGRALNFRRRVSTFFMPSILAIATYRTSRYLYLRGWLLPARLLYMLNMALWGVDISPTTRIGHSFYMPHPVGMNLFGIIGNRCICYTQAGVGGGSGDETDIGAGPGLPVIGDGVMIGARCLVIGPVRVGDGCLIGAAALVTFDVPPYSTVVSKPATILQ